MPHDCARPQHAAADFSEKRSQRALDDPQTGMLQRLYCHLRGCDLVSRHALTLPHSKRVQHASGDPVRTACTHLSQQVDDHDGDGDQEKHDVVVQVKHGLRACEVKVQGFHVGRGTGSNNTAKNKQVP
eukprot:1160067-Pelagomonas_calceolata.AAC.8